MKAEAITSANQADPGERFFLLIWGLISFWLLACAFMVGGEFGDGYQTIVNARYFFGDSADYYVQRGPLAALALAPVEVIAGMMDLHPVDVRPYHLYSGLLHSAYLIGCWLLLRRMGQPFASRIIAFAAAILSVTFYANAPYLSHDIIPGLLFLLLIFLCDRYIREPTAGLAMLLVLIGTSVTFIKQTFALFWVAICLYALLAFLLRWNGMTFRRLISLGALAALSAALTWVGYGWFIGGEAPDTALLERPIILTRSIWSQYELDGDIPSLFPPDLYLRNLHNYGIATALMVVPGVVMALRGGDARLRMVAVCWLTSVVFMQVVSFKEVRYLAFLAPLSAALVVPVVSVVLKSRALLPALIAVFAVDQYRALTMAAAQLSATPGMDVTRFVGDLDNEGKIISSSVFSFVYMAQSPILRDRYHGIFHLTADHVYRLNEGRTVVRELYDPRDLGVIGVEPGDRVLYHNTTLVRRPPWAPGNVPRGIDDLVMSSGNASIIQLDRSGDQFLISEHPGRFVMLIPLADSGKQMPIITNAGMSVAQAEAVYGDMVDDSFSVLAVVLDTICQADRCIYF